MHARLLALALVLCAAACGDDDDHPADASLPIDAAVLDAPISCLVADPLGTLGALDTHIAGHYGAADQDTFYVSRVSGGVPADYLEIELWQGNGVFAAGAGGIRPGTFSISGAETNYATCGLCVFVWADQPNDFMLPPAQYYLAQSGTVTLSSVAGSLVGTLTDVRFVHVKFGLDANTTPADDGCGTTIASASFSAAIDPMIDAGMIDAGMIDAGMIDAGP